MKLYWISRKYSKIDFNVFRWYNNHLTEVWKLGDWPLSSSAQRSSWIPQQESRRLWNRRVKERSHPGISVPRFLNAVEAAPRDSYYASKMLRCLGLLSNKGNNSYSASAGITTILFPDRLPLRSCNAWSSDSAAVTRWASRTSRQNPKPPWY